MIAGTDTTFRPEPELLQLFPAIELSGRHALVAAVSGGSDSLALLFLTKTWLEAAAPGVRLVAVTVDHGLRPESAAEARDVAALCARHGIAHRTMRWQGAKPASAIQASARVARYRLLAEAAAAAGTDIVLAGHTVDDQAETVAMRGARGEGRGLAGMAPATLFEGRTWIVRPLIAARREALRNFLRQNGIGWAEDPSNVDRKYERARVRSAREQMAATSQSSLSPSLRGEEQSHMDGRPPLRFALQTTSPPLDGGEEAPAATEGLPSSPSGGGRGGLKGRSGGRQDPYAITPLRGGGDKREGQVHAAAVRVALGKAAAALIRAHARLAAPGLIALDRAFAAADNKDAAIYALRILLASAGGREQLPDLARSATLFGRLGDAGWRATLSRAVVDTRRTGIFLHRERRGLPEPTKPYDGMIWDGRYRIETLTDAGQIAIAPFGGENARQAKLAGIDAPESLVRAALACEPAVGWRLFATLTPPSPRLELVEGSREEGRGEGQSPEITAIPLVAPWAQFLPSFDLAAARALAELLCCEALPGLPFVGHNEG
ncbi:PP-loop family protein [Mesorhizobium albiziae]|uniref:tRNA(Ile)-lysidine synthase n=2 Tax=Neomesorhizobium albiziae TaxID=335020 RepID=A0A1I3XDG9_9HYPH|nr:tRNA lysidine(34) synthetase TilS [Mesorhizobium albiziae]SFK17575.1 PP-loop family protein [Mesorhizobium albiziae]